MGQQCTSPHPFIRPPSEPIAIPNQFRIAVFGDWATGLYGAPDTAKSIERDIEGYDLILHLGDIYFSGTKSEIEDRLLAFWPRVPNALNRALLGNHEMASGGHAYFENLLPRFNQPASCFALQNDHWTFVALDTSSMGPRLGAHQLRWLRKIVEKAADRRIVLFSHHHPFSHFEAGGDSEVLSHNLKDFLEVAGVAAWYWGHEHRCILYETHPVWGLFGRCVGNGGFPETRPDLQGGFHATEMWSQVHTSDFHNPPSAFVLDSPNAYVAGYEKQFGPHGYMRLDFDDHRIYESVRSSEGQTHLEVEDFEGFSWWGKSTKSRRELAVPPTALPARYADYTFYKEDDSGNRAEELSAERPLKKGLRYELEVAVRLESTGVKSKEDTKPIREPGQEKPVEIIVTATSEYFLIPQPVQKLILPPEGDSEKNARFRCVEPLRTTGSGPRLPLKIRLYYKRNLLEVGNIEAKVVDPLDPDPVSPGGFAQPIEFSQERLESEYKDLDQIVAREMHIDISKGPGGLQFSFILDRGKKDELALVGSSEIGEHDLESIFLGIRKALLGITMWDEFKSRVECNDEARFDKAMNRLAQLGSKLWNHLFFFDISSSMFLIGKWLRDNPLPRRSMIQISVAANASTFLFPWSVLYDRKVPRDESEGPDLQGFWGLRYAVEHRIPGALAKSDEPISVEGKLDLGFLISRFKEAVEQRQFLNDLVQRSQGRIGEVTPIASSGAGYEYLQDCSSQIVYVFAHGHTQFPNANRFGFSESDFVEFYDRLDVSDPLRTSWEQNYLDIKNGLYDSDRSWIKLGDGKLYLNPLYEAGQLQLHKNPVVFLNMCESAQVTPTGGLSFVHLFLNRGARDVLVLLCHKTCHGEDPCARLAAWQAPRSRRARGSGNTSTIYTEPSATPIARSRFGCT